MLIFGLLASCGNCDMAALSVWRCIVFTLAFSGAMRNTLSQAKLDISLFNSYIFYAKYLPRLFSRVAKPLKYIDGESREERKLLCIKILTQSIRRERSRRRKKNRPFPGHRLFVRLFGVDVHIIRTFFFLSVDIFIRISRTSNAARCISNQTNVRDKIRAGSGLKIAFLCSTLATKLPANDGATNCVGNIAHLHLLFLALLLFSFTVLCARFLRPFLLLPSSRRFLHSSSFHFID